MVDSWQYALLGLITMETSLALQGRRLGQILHFTKFEMCFSSMPCLFPPGSMSNSATATCFNQFFAYRAVHRCIAGRKGIEPMEMVEASLAAIRLRFSTKPALMPDR